jgi:hypothetical protein
MEAAATAAAAAAAADDKVHAVVENITYARIHLEDGTAEDASVLIPAPLDKVGDDDKAEFT